MEMEAWIHVYSSSCLHCVPTTIIIQKENCLITPYNHLKLLSNFVMKLERNFCLSNEKFSDANKPRRLGLISLKVNALNIHNESGRIVRKV